MAVSNRALINMMMEELSHPLNDYLCAYLGDDWIGTVRRRETADGVTGKAYNPLDVQEQFKAISMSYGVFAKAKAHEVVNYASELRDVRNDWAHMNAFTNDRTLRALDTGARLLERIGANDQAAVVRRSHDDLNRRVVNSIDRKVLNEQANTPAVQGLKPWREVLQPHDDVATGNFRSSEFAADLYKVANSPEEVTDYSNARAFFERTYLTDGLRDLIGNGVRRLAGDPNASPVINLQTNFGGGKTHSMLALWHLASNEPLGSFPQEFQELLTESGYIKDGQPLRAHRAALVGNHMEPTGRIEADGTRINTMWGELAWQLGGREAFNLVAESDASGTNPGRALHTLLERYSPAVILIDEWVAYARGLFDRDDLPAGTFDTQFTFAQLLTEAAKSTPGVLLAISIPASYDADDDAAGNNEEVGGRNGQEALKRLQNVVRRVADQWRPASSTESYHIVRQRLFKAPDADAQAAITATARAFVDYYRINSTSFPKDTTTEDYVQQMRQTYPIHPEVFERLYEDWASLERFQRTRGVLRLMNAVIYALWDSGDQSPMILPGSIPLFESSVNSELTQYLSDSWKSVIDADVDGPQSEPWRIDSEKPLFGQRQITKRLARATFFGSAPTLGTSQKGLEAQRLFLGVATPGDTVNTFHSALANLGDRATYFYNADGRYWYDLRANISRRAKDQADSMVPEDVWAEIERRLKATARAACGFTRVHVAPADSGDVLDVDETRLIILSPRVMHHRNTESTALKAAQQFTATHGTSNRANRNMVIFLAADDAQLENLDAATRTYLGWDYVISHAADLDLTINQQQQAQTKRDAADRTVNDRLALIYIWAMVPTQTDGGQPFTVEAIKTESSSSVSLAERVSRKLGNEDLLRTRQAAGAVRLELNRYPVIWDRGYVSVGDLWSLYAQYPYMPRLRDQQVLIDGLTEHQTLTWERDGFAIAQGVDADGRFEQLWLPTDDGTPVVTMRSLIVKPELAKFQRESERPIAPDPVPGPADASSREPTPVPVPVEPSAHPKTRLFAATRLSADTAPSEFSKLNQEVLRHLIGDLGTDVRIRVEIEATCPEGFEESVMRTVTENARTLGFQEADFEE